MGNVCCSSNSLDLLENGGASRGQQVYLKPSEAPKLNSPRNASPTAVPVLSTYTADASVSTQAVNSSRLGPTAMMVTSFDPSSSFVSYTGSTLSTARSNPLVPAFPVPSLHREPSLLPTDSFVSPRYLLPEDGAYPQVMSPTATGNFSGLSARRSARVNAVPGNEPGSHIQWSQHGQGSPQELVALEAHRYPRSPQGAVSTALATRPSSPNPPYTSPSPSTYQEMFIYHPKRRQRGLRPLGPNPEQRAAPCGPLLVSSAGDAG